MESVSAGEKTIEQLVREISCCLHPSPYFIITLTKELPVQCKRKKIGTVKDEPVSKKDSKKKSLLDPNGIKTLKLAAPPISYYLLIAASAPESP